MSNKFNQHIKAPLTFLCNALCDVQPCHSNVILFEAKFVSVSKLQRTVLQTVLISFFIDPVPVCFYKGHLWLF